MPFPFIRDHNEYFTVDPKQVSPGISAIAVKNGQFSAGSPMVGSDESKNE